MCKDNFAVNGRGIMPRGGDLGVPSSDVLMHICSTNWQEKPLDRVRSYDIIIFTHFATQEHQVGQTRSASAARMPESTPEAGGRSTVPTRRVLRCQRPGPGQVRDVALCPNRAKAHQPSGRRVWVFAPHLLPGRIGFSEPGTVRVDSRKAWAAESTQADCRSARICATAAIGTTLVGRGPTGHRNSKTLRHYRSSPQHRACSGAPGKKTTLIQESAQGNGAALVAAYEDLRQQALDGVRSEVLGMALLLGQGMAAWMKACSATFAVPASGCIPPATPVPLASDLHGEVVRVLASMALGQTYSRSV